MPPMSTINVGVVEGGTAGNILARECKLLWISRLLPSDDQEEIERRAFDYLQNTLLPAMRRKHPEANIVTEMRSSTPPFSPEGNDEAKALARAWSGSNVVGSVPYGTEAGIFRKTLGVPTVVCGPGDIAQAHQPNEFILKSQIAACEVFMRRMVEWAERQ
jgi:acetylornithine deacetylase